MEYVSIDFETANTSFDSACAIGLCLFSSEGEELDSYYSLIRPKELVFDTRCTMVHNLDPYDIANAKSLPELWSDILAFIGDRALVAHNAPFDMKVLKASAESHNLGGLDNDYYCTLSLSRKMLRLPSYRLSAIAEHFSWTYRAHMALDDAYVCGLLFSRLCGSALFKKDSFDSFILERYKPGSAGYPKHISLESSLLF